MLRKGRRNANHFKLLGQQHALKTRATNVNKERSFKNRPAGRNSIKKGLRFLSKACDN